MPVAGVGESLPLLKVVNKTASYSCTIDDCGTWFTNNGSGAAFPITLPLGSTLPQGWWIGINNCGGRAAGARFVCQSPDTIQVPSGTGSAGGALGQQASGRANGEVLALAWFGSTGGWAYIYGYPFDWTLGGT